MYIEEDETTKNPILFEEEENNYEITEEDRQILESILMKGEWVEEAEQIPIEELNNEEQLVIVKCRNKEDINEQEKEILREVLGRYREAIRKFEPKETIENVEKNIQVMQDMNSILAKMRASKETQTLKFYYPLSTSEDLLIELIVDNEIDAEAIDDLQENLGLFEDLTQQELETYSQYANKKPMTREEQAIAMKIEEKIAKMSHSKVSQIRQTAIAFLSKQTRLAHDPTVTEEDMKVLYSEMKVGPLLALFERLQSEVGLSHIDRDELFR